MKLRSKILLLAAVPLLVAVMAIALSVRQQALELAQREKQLVQSAWLDSKQNELRHYVSLARSAIAPLAAQAPSDEKARQQALELLSRMEFGTDGYFFVYDLGGRSLMHPRQPELVGRELWNLTDPQGRPVIQTLLAAAREGGAQGQTVRYLWQKPSSHQTVEKLGYVTVFEPWGWMVGTGIYLDDVEEALSRIDHAAQSNITTMFTAVAVITAVGLLGVTLCGLALNISDHRQSDAKLRLMAQRVVSSQEDERAYLSRELHDGVSQLLISIKFSLEAAMERLRGGEGAVERTSDAAAAAAAAADADAAADAAADADADAATAADADAATAADATATAATDAAAAADAASPSIERALSDALQRLHHTVGEIRRISHHLRPALLDDLGLPAALNHLAREASDPPGNPLNVKIAVSGTPITLPAPVGTALFRIAQEALTNASKHARAREVLISLAFASDGVMLTVEDNGKGFDQAAIQRDPSGGIGLRNMRERAESIDGRLTIRSTRQGTRVQAHLPG